MAHWRKTPDEIKKLTSSDLELMEFAFLLLERRNSETTDNIFGTMLGTSWDAESLLGKEANSKTDFTWAYRRRKPKVFLPVVTALNQNPKFSSYLKQMASSAVNNEREDPSVISAPTWADRKTQEFVDLSTVSKEEFKKFAGQFIN
jgi:hypothetical protein